MIWKLHKAIQVIHHGGVIAYPTEAVWGVGCDPDNETALLRLLAMKQRDWRKGLILISGCVGHFAELLEGLNRNQQQTIRASWPGHVTWVVPDPGRYSELVRGSFPTVAIRVTKHPLVAALTRQLDSPIISTSANPAAFPPARNRLKARCYFRDLVDHYLAGPLGGEQQPSQIRDAISGRVIRS